MPPSLRPDLSLRVSGLFTSVVVTIIDCGGASGQTKVLFRGRLASSPTATLRVCLAAFLLLLLLLRCLLAALPTGAVPCVHLKDMLICDCLLLLPLAHACPCASTASIGLVLVVVLCVIDVVIAVGVVGGAVWDGRGDGGEQLTWSPKRLCGGGVVSLRGWQRRAPRPRMWPVLVRGGVRRGPENAVLIERHVLQKMKIREVD